MNAHLFSNQNATVVTPEVEPYTTRMTTSWNEADPVSITVDFVQPDESTVSWLLARDMFVDCILAEPGITFTRRSNLRVGVSCRLTAKQNAEKWGGQRYTAEAWNGDFKYNILQSTSIQGRFTMSNIVYTATGGKTPSTTSAVSYTILEGLQPGKNYLWNLDLIKKLGNNLELSLQYEGRKAGSTGIVHTGRAALRALL